MSSLRTGPGFAKTQAMTISVSRRYDEPDQMRTVSSTETYTGGPPFPSFTHTEIARRRRGSYSGWKTPGWRRMIAQGGIVPFQPYARYDELSSQSGHRFLKWRIGDHFRTARITSCCIFEDFNLLPSENELYGIANSYGLTAERLLQTAASDILDGFDALTFMAELKDVKKMFLSLAPRLLRQLAKKPIEESAPSVWLQWQMGWKPFISDLNEMYQIISHPSGAVRSKKNRKSDRSLVSGISLSKILLNGETHTVTGETRIEIKVNSAVIADISAFLANFNFNPIQTAWELIPYSFLVDYFIEVGNWIAANSLVLSGVEYSACVGYDISLDRKVVLTGKPPEYGSLVNYTCGGNASVSARLRLRTPRRISIANPPAINTDMQSVTHMLNMVAIAMQLR